MIKFDDDKLDQTESLLSTLKLRENDNSKGLLMKGNHTLIASAGLREDLLGEWADDAIKRKTIERISHLIDDFN